MRITPGSKIGTSIIEYSVLIALLCAVFLTMQIYLKQAIQGKTKASVDMIGEQYSAENSNYLNARIVKSTRQETTATNGETKSELLSPEIVWNGPYADRFSDKKLTEETLFKTPEKPLTPKP